mgnify:FL=1
MKTDLSWAMLNEAMNIMLDQRARARKDPDWLYRKLRPYLRVQVCRHSWHHEPYVKRGLHPWPHKVGAAAVIRWAPGERERDRCEPNWLERPTYAEFCHWYGLDPGKGMEA